MELLKRRRPSGMKTLPHPNSIEISNNVTTGDTHRDSSGHSSTSAQNDHTSAQDNHTSAQDNHTSAQDNHTSAQDNHTSAQDNHTSAQDNHTRRQNNHTRRQNNHSRPQYGAQNDHSSIQSPDPSLAHNSDLQRGDFIRQKPEHSLTSTRAEGLESQSVYMDMEVRKADQKTPFIDGIVPPVPQDLTRHPLPPPIQDNVQSGDPSPFPCGPVKHDYVNEGVNYVNGEVWLANSEETRRTSEETRRTSEETRRTSEETKPKSPGRKVSMYCDDAFPFQRQREGPEPPPKDPQNMATSYPDIPGLGDEQRPQLGLHDNVPLPSDAVVTRRSSDTDHNYYNIIKQTQEVNYYNITGRHYSVAAPKPHQTPKIHTYVNEK